MEKIALLEQEYLLLKMGVGSYDNCIEWAEHRLQCDEEGDDLDIVLLAGARVPDEILSLVEKIIVRYRGEDKLDNQLAAGKYIVRLRDLYLNGAETVESIDSKLTKLYWKLGYPDWMVMLSRNCEYAADVPAFLVPFEQEFSYIAELWRAVSTRQEFESKYNRRISNQHDLVGLRSR